MTNTIRVDTQYTMAYETEIDLPEGKTWEDVKSWYIKYHSLSVVFNDETTEEHNLDDNGWEDSKRPDGIQIYKIDEDGDEELVYE
tara:strand:+ start:644 stop:898 length:255 start_codon:yes stop_codon:yes gene_type:complete